MTLLAVERIKLFSTRSPWWCMVIAVVVTVGLAALIAGHADILTVDRTEYGYQFGLVVVMVMAALAVTTEYRTGTIKTTYTAVPNRTAVLLAKTTVVAVLAGVVGEVTAWASLGIAKVVKPSASLDINSEQAWRTVAGIGLIYLIGAVIAVAVGILFRHTAGVIALLLIYVLLVEQLVQIVPSVGQAVHRWLPFNAAGSLPVRRWQGRAATR